MEESLLRQMEFYFSNSNLAKDSFLRSKMAENEEGWIPLSLFLSFNKPFSRPQLTHRIKAITTDIHEIQKVLETSRVLLLNEDKSSVKRKTEYTEREIPPGS